MLPEPQFRPRPEREQRTLSSYLIKLTKRWPMVIVAGPRKVGKTTLLRETYSHLPWISLGESADAAQAAHRPARFIERLKGGGIVDEIQACPELIPRLRQEIRDGALKGPILLTGSRLGGSYRPGLNSPLRAMLRSEPPDGTTALATLLPYSLAEHGGVGRDPHEFVEFLFRGGYPEPLDLKTDAALWYRELVTTWVESLVGPVIERKQYATFLRFLRRCIEQTGLPLNMSKMARDIGISQPTVRKWIGILLRDHMAHLLPPHGESYGCRLVRSPKLYFWDTGVVCSLLGFTRESQLASHWFGGKVRETWLVAEVRKYDIHQGRSQRVTFWRDRDGHEITLLVKAEKLWFALDILPSHVRPHRPWPRFLWWQKLTGHEFWLGMLINHQPLSVRIEDLYHMPWHVLPNSPLAKSLDAPSYRVCWAWKRRDDPEMADLLC
jgi:uncharacterized protein